MSHNYLKFFNVLHFTGDQTLINKMLKKVSHRKIPFTLDPNKILNTPRDLSDCGGSTVCEESYAYLTIASPYENREQYPKEYDSIERYDEETYKSICNTVFSVPGFSYADFRAFKPQHDNHKTWVNLYDKKFYEVVLRGKQYVDGILKYGAATIWDWRKEHWGAKWCGYTPLPTYTDNTLIFWSNGSDIRPLIKILSKKFPDIKIEYLWADDKFSHICGECTYLKGEETGIATEISSNKPITDEIVYKIKYDYLKGYTIIEYNDYAKDYILRNEEHPYSAFASKVYLYQLMKENGGLINYDGHPYSYDKYILP